MSTILKTLKKLEEEKSVLEKGLDLKELVLQDEENLFNSPSETPRKIFLISAILFSGIAFGLFLAWKGSPPENQVVRVSPPNTGYYKASIPVKNQYVTPVPGIPLSNIPELEKPYRPTRENNFYAVENEIPNNVERTIEPARPSTVLARGNSQEQQRRDAYEIQSLIETAKLLADEPEEILIPQINKSLSIPDLKVKGIIFFSPESPSNHIFVSNEKSKNHKMRVGDSIDSATLMKIESTGAVFAYQGETAFLNIGR
ncbi:MAG: hypothetical protein ACI8PD_000550 [Nitrospinales bacterium]|jgi:hypothetical protein